MDTVKAAISLLLGDYVERMNSCYVTYLNGIGDLGKNDPLREVLGEERNALCQKICEAKALIQCLKREKA